MQATELLNQNLWGRVLTGSPVVNATQSLRITALEQPPALYPPPQGRRVLGLPLPFSWSSNASLPF